jgi:hypothetical protein
MRNILTLMLNGKLLNITSFRLDCTYAKSRAFISGHMVLSSESHIILTISNYFIFTHN